MRQSLNINLRIEVIVMSMAYHFCFVVYDHILKGSKFNLYMGNFVDVNELMEKVDYLVKEIFFRLPPKSSNGVVDHDIPIPYTVLTAVFKIYDDVWIGCTGVAVHF